MLRTFFPLAMLLLLVAGCSFGPCGSSKTQFLQRFNQLMDEVEATSLPLSDPAWEAFDTRFKSLVEDCYDQYEAELTGREKRNFWFKALGYYKDRFGEAALQEARKRWKGE